MKQLNPIKFHTDKRARVWDSNPESRCSDMVFYPSTDINIFGNTPAFSIIVPTGTTITASILDEFDVFEMNIDDPTIVDKTTYKQAYFIAENHTFTVGYYYILLTVDGTDYYSDMFGVIADLDNLLKFKVTSADIIVGGDTQFLNSFFTEFYLSAEYHGIKPKTEQVGQQVNGITDVLSGAVVFPHEFEIDSNENIYRYLYTLGLLGCNGTILITWGYETFTATDFLVEEIQNNYEGTYQIKLTFVDTSESVQTLNAIT